MNKLNFKDIETVVSAAIALHIGNIAGLPKAAQTKIHDIYKKFFSTYLKILALKGLPQKAGMDDIVGLDGDAIEYMQHFFSDYQGLYREFISLNRHARKLNQINPEKDPAGFEDQLNTLLTGKDQSTNDQILKDLMNH